MDQKKTRSKRQALRFSVVEYPVKYKTEFDDGGGVIDNVSSGGCAISQLTVPLTQHEKILILLGLDEDVLEIGARVLRVEDRYAAVQFINIDDNKREQVVKFFAKRQRTRLSH